MLLFPVRLKLIIFGRQTLQLWHSLLPPLFSTETPSFSGFVRRAFILPLMTYGHILTAQLMVSSVVQLLCSSLGTRC